jgi:cytochrome c oxidase assembly protein subunit 15
LKTRLDHFQRFALITTFATYALIAVGGLVRASGAGLGCPDWPKCFGRWIPPLSAAEVPAQIDPALFNFAKAWTEYINRLLGVVIGLLIFGTLILAIKYHRRAPRILYPTIAAFILVGIEGFIGGKVVNTKLSPIVLTVHLVFAIVIAGALLYATVHAFASRAIDRSRTNLRRFAYGAVVVSLIQAGAGAALRGEVQLSQHAGLPRSVWLENVGAIGAVHVVLSAVTSGVVLALYLYVEKKAAEDRRLRAAALASLLIVVAQVMTGVILSRFDLPPAAQVAHLWLGTLLLGVLMVLALLVDSTHEPKDLGHHVEARPLG